MIRTKPKVKSKGLKRTPLKRKPPIAKGKFLKIDEIKSRGVIRTPPKLRKSFLKPMSKKMQIQRRQEDKLSLKLAELSGNCCEICGKHLPIFGLHKHEIIKRSHQGEETLATNCLLLCMNCHDHRKYPKSGTPLSIDEQLVLAKKLHENIT
jgi:5-methylcytosine-specific restriction endonuclease McrA